MRNTDRAIEPFASLVGVASDFYVADRAGVSVQAVRAYRERVQADGTLAAPPEDDDLPPEPELRPSLEEEFGDPSDLAPPAPEPVVVAVVEPVAPAPKKRGRPRKNPAPPAPRSAPAPAAVAAVPAPARAPAPVSNGRRYAWRITLSGGEVRVVVARNAEEACASAARLGPVDRLERMPEPLLGEG